MMMMMMMMMIKETEADRYNDSRCHQHLTPFILFTPHLHKKITVRIRELRR